MKKLGKYLVLTSEELEQVKEKTYKKAYKLGEEVTKKSSKIRIENLEQGIERKDKST
jgi:hypothetical protein